MTILEAVILGIVEGLTEFLPVSSTGHMILTQAALGVQSSSFVKAFLINIQFGAILAVLFIYFDRFLKSFALYKSLIIAFIPAAVTGLLLNDFIDSLLESVPVVALMLIIGGVIMIWADSYFKELRNEEVNEDIADYQEDVLAPNAFQSFVIGLAQCVAMVPGVSRSAATIIGALTQKLSFRQAAEYSFFLAVPTISAAALFKTIKTFDSIKGSDLKMLFIGNIAAFFVAIIAIKFFISVLNKYGLKFFGIYRIILGLTILVGIYIFNLPLQILK